MSEMTPEWPSPPATPIPAPVYTPATPEVAWDRPVPTPRADREPGATAMSSPFDATIRAAPLDGPVDDLASLPAERLRLMVRVAVKAIEGLRAENLRLRGQLAGRTVQVVYTGKAEPLPYPPEDEPSCATCAELDGWLTLARQENRALRGQLADAQAAAVRAGKGRGAE